MMKSTTFALFALFCILGAVLGGGAAQAKVLDPATPLNEPVQSSLIGRSVLIEEITTTWCESCADIDPYLMGVADAHGSRIAMVAYHPSDNLDAFQPPAAQHRIDRLGLLHGNLLSTPTFFVEGESPRTGLDAWNEVQRDILDAEVQRQDTTTLQFEVVQTQNITTARVLSFESNSEQLHQTQLTFMVMHHGKSVPTDAINPGEATRDRVVVATAECSIGNTSVTNEIGMVSSAVNQSCTSDFTVSFENLEEFSVLLIHENTIESISEENAGLGTHGAVEVAFRSRESQDSNSFTTALLVLAVGAGIIAILPRKGSKNLSE